MSHCKQVLTNRWTIFTSNDASFIGGKSQIFDVMIGGDCYERPGGLMHILLIDDDKAMVDLLTDYLMQFHCQVQSASRWSEAQALFRTRKPDIVLLDVMLPDQSGFEVCRLIRSLHPQLPIIMLTARGDITDRVVGLELGADDYVPKPFDPRELLARIQSVLRRSTAQAVPNLSLLSVGSLSIGFASQDVTVSGKLVDLTSTEFFALRLLAEHAGHVVDREQFSTVLKGTDWNVNDRSIDMLIGRVRQKLGDDPRKPRMIRTVRGSGYMLVASCQIDEGES